MAGRLDVLTSLSGSPVRLLNPINNAVQDLHVGLCEFTYTTGWVNISDALGNNKFAVRPSAAAASTTWTVPDGYYSVDTLKELIQERLPGFSATMNNATADGPRAVHLVRCQLPAKPDDNGHYVGVYRGGVA
jgi:hypothetical protein